MDFFSNHGFIFLFFITLFPRLTLLISGLIFHSIEFGGLLWWLGFIFAPRILVAVLATISYWETNPFLVIISWIIALSGESSEKIIFKRKVYRSPKRHNQVNQGPVIDADFTVEE